MQISNSLLCLLIPSCSQQMDTDWTWINFSSCWIRPGSLSLAISISNHTLIYMPFNIWLIYVYTLNNF